MVLSLAACFLLLHLCDPSVVNTERPPRMIFTEQGISVNSFKIQNMLPVQILLEGQPDTVLAAGQTYLKTYNFQNRKTNHRVMQWEDCSDEQDCSYNITLVHLRKDANQLFVCGTNGRETVCCDTDLTQQLPWCISFENMQSLRAGISRFSIKEGEPSALVESEQSTDLYITQSGSQDFVGIHKFGKGRVGPLSHNKEQYYVGLVLSRRKEDPSQNRVYGFYKEKNKDPGLYSKMWLPFVTQVCMTDVGGPKNNLQFTWTSQMSARLFCGNLERRQYFSELVDVATVHADRWQDTQIYALFRNEWGMSAVCVYTIEDINKIFTNSTFKNYATDRIDVPRACASDSTKIPVDILKKISKVSEMERSVQPVGGSGFLLFKHHMYTHIRVDSLPNERSSNTVIFLSLNDGRIHKVLQNESGTFDIAEFQPRKHREHVLSFILHPASKNLYVTSESELVQLDVADCKQYGNTCLDCILSRDPYCHWNGFHCAPLTKLGVVTENVSICNNPSAEALRSSSSEPSPVTVRPHSNHFMRCPVSSHDAQYSWQHRERSTSCSMREDQCLYLIDSMDAEHEGTYECISEEMGFRKVMATYRLQLGNKAAGGQSKPMIWVALMVVLIKSLSC